jgi:hypothetical protein
VGFLSWDLGSRDKADVVEISVRGSTANVLLMESGDFSTFSPDGSYRWAYGGLGQRSRVHLTIPDGGHWYVVVRLGRVERETSVIVRMLPKPLPLSGGCVTNGQPGSRGGARIRHAP